MSAAKTAPYGAWKSPITSDLIVAESIGFQQLALDGDDIYWSEMRPQEGGRYVVVRRTPDGQIQDVTPAGFNVRTRVHEYGGGAFTVHDGTVYFSNFADQRLYRQAPGAAPAPLTPEGRLRYADGVVDTHRQRLICVREDHSAEGQEAVNTLVAISLAAAEPDPGTVLVAGHDFYSTPRLSPDGRRLAWLAWNHPEMPWTASELWVATLAADGSVGAARRVAGSGATGSGESIFQPAWSPDSVLYFVSDRGGWWNLHRWRNGAVDTVTALDAEFGEPQWIFGAPTYGFASDEEILCAYTQDDAWRLASLNVESLELAPYELPFTDVGSVQVGARSAAFIGGSPREATAVVRLELATRHVDILRRATQVTVDPGYLSAPEAVEFPTENGLTAHGILYRPNNQDYAAPADERPPLMVISHGGPTGAAGSAFNLSIQYWTSRGFAVLDVNYGGSTGYGRAYRQRLDGQWGIVDVDDCANGARHLVAQGVVDANRLIIRGGSAGGYTTLAALAFRDVFKAGASYFGVSDLEALATETHKFESRYLDGLIGPYPARRDLYLERSPLHHTAGFSCPTIFFQGLEDKIVLPNQAEMMVDALRKKGVPVAYIAYEGEQHGFRQAQNIKRSLDAELSFYAQVFGFEPADPIEPVAIENLSAAAKAAGQEAGGRKKAAKKVEATAPAAEALPAAAAAAGGEPSGEQPEAQP